MSFILILSIASVQLSKSSAKQSKLALYKVQAQQNARLALQIAMAELQFELGPDQRISANMGIMAGNPKAKDFDGKLGDDDYAHPHLLASWNSWTQWLNTNDGNGDDIRKTYDRGRRSQFRKLLVSHPQAETLNTSQWLDFAMNGSAELDSATLLGPGYDNDKSHRVTAPLIYHKDGSSPPHGAHAWFISGNNQKANLTLQDKTNNADSLAATSHQLETLRTNGIGKTHHPSLSSYPKESSSVLSKVITLDNAGLAAQAPVNNYLTKNFHAFTPHSQSLLTNVRDGGLKMDLNAFLERKELPSEFQFAAEHENIRSISGSENSIQRADINFPISTSSILTSWHKLHQYYNEYKKSKIDSANHNPNLIFYSHKSPTTPRFLGLVSGRHYGMEKLDEIHRAPVVALTNTIYSIQAGTDTDPNNNTVNTVDLVATPIVALWNPYPHTLNIAKHRVSIAPVLQFSILNINSNAEEEFTKYKPRKEVATVLDEYSCTADAIMAENVIPLAPGETRIFAPTSRTTGANVDVYNDYNPATTFNCGGTLLRYNLADGTDYNDYVLKVSYRDRGIKATRTNPTDMEWTVKHVRNHASYKEFFGTDKMLHPSSDNNYNFYPINIDGPIINVGSTLKGGNVTVGGSPVSPQLTKHFLFSVLDSRYGQHDGPDKSLPHDTRALAAQDFYIREINSPSDVGIPTQLGDTNLLRLFAATGNTQAIIYDHPLVPTISIAGFNGFRLEPSKYRLKDTSTNHSHMGNGTLNQGNVNFGIGNSFASPLLAPNQIHSSSPLLTIAANANNGEFGQAVFDRPFLCNDALFDRWFCSSITAQENSNGTRFHRTASAKDLFTQLAEDGTPLPNPQLILTEASPLKEANAELFSGGATKPNAHKLMAKHLQVLGGFNVNSTSVDAWKALFMGLAGGEFTYRNLSNGGISSGNKIKVPEDRVLISRFSVPCSPDEAQDAQDPAAWQGVRYLTVPQIEKLAEECVRQVKLRGPFLNMADFVNRRLTAQSQDEELARCGALQAAIDWDEFNQNSPQQSSINGRFKKNADMITTSPVYTDGAVQPSSAPAAPYPRAHYGSKWTNIPGYVMQADILKRIGNQITVRDDSFTIRCYGDCRDTNGKVRAVAYCEATLQRNINYYHAEDSAEIQPDSLKNTNNKQYGRKFHIVSFKWLNESEI